MVEMAEEARPFTGEVEIDESYFGPRRVRRRCGRGAGGKTPVLRSHQKKNEQNDEDQSEATDWIIFDFSEEEAMARRSA